MVVASRNVGQFIELTALGFQIGSRATAGTTVRKMALAIGMVLALLPTTAFGQTETAPGVGVSIFATGGGDVGVAAPISVGESFRIEPLVSLDYESVAISAGAFERDESRRVWSVGSAFQYVVIGSEEMRVFGGAEVLYRSGREETLDSTTAGGVTVTEEEISTVSGLGLVPHLAAEIFLPESFYLGLRAGPGFFFPLAVDVEGSPADLEISGYASEVMHG